MEKDLLRSLTTAPARTDWVNVFLISSIWLGMVVLVNPIGNFPLNDDWAYGWTVKTLLETGEYQLSDWAATNLLPQVIWGTAFCLPFGFSFTALRISTLVLGLLGVLLTYALLREVEANSRLATFGALVIALNPVYFALSNSFNNDIPAFTFTICSLYLITRGLKLNSILLITFGVLIALISILNRQSSIVVLVSFSLAFLVRKGLKPKTVFISFLPVTLGLLLQLAYSQWLEQTEKKPILYGFQIKNLQETFSAGLFNIVLTYSENAIIISAYLGLFLFPFLVACFSDHLPSLKKRSSFLLLLAAIAIGIVLVIKNKRMPLVGNTLETFGVGPTAFDDYSSSLSSNVQILVHGVWKFLTLISFAGAALFLMCCTPAFLEILNIKKRDELNRKRLLFLIISSALTYFGLIGALDQQYWFDRYLIFLLPVFMMLFAAFSPNALEGKPKPGLVASIMIILLIYGSFSLGATHDYLSWNRARWQALNNLMETTKVLPKQIYGGFEFNGWYFGNQLKVCNPTYQSQANSASIDWGTFDCLWGNDTETYRYLYTLGFVDKPGYGIEKQYSFKRWLPWKNQNLYVLKRI